MTDPLSSTSTLEPLLALELLSDLAPTEMQLGELAGILLAKVDDLFPGAATISGEPNPDAGYAFFRSRIGIVSRPPNDAELPTSLAWLAGLALPAAGPFENPTILVTLSALNRAADEHFPAIQERIGDELVVTSVGVRFDPDKNDIVTDLGLVRLDGAGHGPWVATLTDRPVARAAIEVKGGLGCDRLRRKLEERRPIGVLGELLHRLQTALTTVSIF